MTDGLGAGARQGDLAQGVLARLSAEMVRAQKEAFGRGPERTTSYLVDDMLFIVMRGGITTAERTMLDAGRTDLVRRFRQVFENDMTTRMTGMVEELTGRSVVTYQSLVMFDPDTVVEIFVFDGPRPGSADRAEARDAPGRAEVASTGEAGPAA